MQETGYECKDVGSDERPCRINDYAEYKGYMTDPPVVLVLCLHQLTLLKLLYLYPNINEESSEKALSIHIRETLYKRIHKLCAKQISLFRKILWYNPYIILS